MFWSRADPADPVRQIWYIKLSGGDYLHGQVSFVVSRSFVARHVCGHRARRRGGVSAGPSAEPARTIRLLCAVALLVAVVLRLGGRAWNAPAGPMRSATILVRGAWSVAAI